MISPVPAVMVSCGDVEGKKNIITIAWTGTICSEPAMCYISVRKERHSYQMIKESGEFVINLTTEALARATDWCGVRSGKDFDKFDRPGYTGVKFAGMLQYDGDLNIPENYLVQPPVIKNTLTEVLCAAGIHEYAVSETQKYGHVTYFWNGNRSGKVCEELEVYEEIPSDVIPFEQAPAMKSKEITEKMVAAMAKKKFQFLRCNFPNGDMVGHTGVMEAVVYAMECVDNGLKAILEAADKYGYTVLITADHGNADQMTETKKGKTSVRTAHSLNPVPFIIYDKDTNWTIKEGAYGLANVAPTVVKMMGLEAPECWEESMI